MIFLRGINVAVMFSLFFYMIFKFDQIFNNLYYLILFLFILGPIFVHLLFSIDKYIISKFILDLDKKIKNFSLKKYSLIKSNINKIYYIRNNETKELIEITYTKNCDYADYEVEEYSKRKYLEFLIKKSETYTLVF